MKGDEILVYQCYPLGSVRPCYYDFKRKTTFWNRRLNFQVVNPPDGFAQFYGDAPGRRAAPTEMDRPQETMRNPQPDRLAVSGKWFPHETLPWREPPAGRRQEASVTDLFDFSGPSPAFFRKLYFPSDLFLLRSGRSLRQWLIANVSSENPAGRLLPCRKNSDVAMLGSIGSGFEDQAKQLAKDILKFIAKAEPGRPYALAYPIIAQLHKYTDLIPEAGVRLLAETHTPTVSQKVRNAWDLFLLYCGTFVVPREMNDVLRAWMLLVASCPQVDPEIAKLASVCLFRLSCGAPVRVPFGTSEEDHQRYVMSVISRENHPTIFGVSIAEILHFELRSTDDVRKVFLVPKVVRRLIIYIRDERGTTLPDLFWNDRTPPDTLKKLVNSLTMGGRLISGREEDAGRALDLSTPGVYHAANLLKYFFEMLQKPLITPEVIAELAQTPVLDSARCLSMTYRLPNEHRDTLMFLVGFFQEILRARSAQILREDALRLVRHIYRTLFRPPDDCKLHDSMQLLLAMLIESWRTDDVYLSFIQMSLSTSAVLGGSFLAATTVFQRKRRFTRSTFKKED
jgi:hypothetical protein